MGTKTVAVDKCDTRHLAATAAGSGMPFVWGHSLLGSMAQEEAAGIFQWDSLQDIARVIRFDAIGHGESEASPNPEDHTWTRRADDVLAVAGNLSRRKQIVLGGASMGSATALHAAVRAPERVKGLVLAIPPTAWEEREHQSQLYRRFSALLELLGGEPFRWLSWLARYRRRGDRGFRQALEREVALGFDPDNVAAIRAALDGAAASDLPPESVLSELQVPTLILAWPDDRVHPLSTAHKLAAILPDARLSVATDPTEPYQWPEQVRQFLLSL